MCLKWERPSCYHADWRNSGFYWLTLRKQNILINSHLSRPVDEKRRSDGQNNNNSPSVRVDERRRRGWWSDDSRSLSRSCKISHRWQTDFVTLFTPRLVSQKARVFSSLYSVLVLILSRKKETTVVFVYRKTSFFCHFNLSRLFLYSSFPSWEISQDSSVILFIHSSSCIGEFCPPIIRLVGRRLCQLNQLVNPSSPRKEKSAFFLFLSFWQRRRKTVLVGCDATAGPSFSWKRTIHLQKNERKNKEYLRTRKNICR